MSPDHVDFFRTPLCPGAPGVPDTACSPGTARHLGQRPSGDARPSGTPPVSVDTGVPGHPPRPTEDTRESQEAPRTSGFVCVTRRNH